jgi:3-oxoacyl-[acyl-carrier protein] reductase
VLNKAPRTALVTGSASGIGLAIAEQLASEGWLVIGWDKASSTSPSVTPGLHHQRVDLSDPMQISEALVTLKKAKHAPMALIHAAGFMSAGPLSDMANRKRQAKAQTMWQVHVHAVSQMVAALLPAMQKKKCGRVVLIGSRVANGMPMRSQYAASKAALISLSRSWAAEVIGDGVTVNVLSPAATQTQMLSSPSRRQVAPKLPPLGRFIQPQEIAATVSFLLSDHAQAITGQNLKICGGASLDY